MDRPLVVAQYGRLELLAWDPERVKREREREEGKMVPLCLVCPVQENIPTNLRLTDLHINSTKGEIQRTRKGTENFY